MRFKYTILYVDDVAGSIAFFERAFGVVRRMIHESGDYAELDTGSTTLSFSSRRLMIRLGKSPGRPDPSSPVFEIAFEVEDVAASLEKACSAGARAAAEDEVAAAVLHDQEGMRFPGGVRPCREDYINLFDLGLISINAAAYTQPVKKVNIISSMARNCCFQSENLIAKVASPTKNIWNLWCSRFKLQSSLY